MQCPCENCLVKALCRNKSYHRLHTQCRLVSSYLLMNNYDDGWMEKHKIRVKILAKTLNSNTWSLGNPIEGGYELIEENP